MRRLLTFAAFFLVVSLLPVCAQRGGGGHASAGGHGGGFSSHGGFSGHPSMGGGIGVAHGSSYSPAHSHTYVASGSHSTYYHNNRGPRIYTYPYGYRNRCYGCLGYYPYYGYYDPYWWWDSGSSYDQDDAQQRAMANDMNAENLDLQDRLRAEDQDAYAPPMRRPQPTPVRNEPATAKMDPATVLVFRDQHVEEVHNYAISGGTLWVLNEQSSKKIPLAQLDIPATVKQNDDRGVDFQVPGPSLQLMIMQ
jgi:hypothetical protein